MKQFVQAHWKAIMPLIAGVVALLADHLADLGLSPETKTIVASVLAAILVYLKSNTAPALPAPAPPDKDAGLGMLEVIVIIVGLAVVLIAIKVF